MTYISLRDYLYNDIKSGKTFKLHESRILKKQPVSWSTVHDSERASKPTLYGDVASPPVRFVLMTASFLNIELNYHHIDLFTEQNRSEFYEKINPLRKVPAMKITEQVICDSHAIAIYLCDQSENSLYPADPLTRAKINQMLFFNSSNLFPVDSLIFTEFFAGKWPVNEDLVEKWNASLNYLEKHLTLTPWLSGDQMFLCDLCCAATISSCRFLVPLQKKHERINQWLKKLEDVPCFEINAKGLQRLNSFVQKVKQ